MSIDNHRSGANPSDDYTSFLPDECLALIFHSLLLPEDRRHCSLVCRRWLTIEGPTRRRLSLSLPGNPSLPSLFSRFPSITHLSLRGGRVPDDEALILTSLHSIKNTLTRLTLLHCRITPDVIEALSNASARLEELHLNRVEVSRRSTGLAPRAAAASSSSLLKLICLNHIYNFGAESFAPLIKASKSLTTLKIIWPEFDTVDKLLRFDMVDTLLRSLSDSVTEIHMECVGVNDEGLSAISTCCPNLETLRLWCAFGSSDAGIGMVAKGCKSLRGLHVYRIGDEGLMAVAENCLDLEELALDESSVTELSLGMLGANCVKLEGLVLSHSLSVGDDELMCIAAKCNALKKLGMEFCVVSDRGIQALASGCPNLAKVMFQGCDEVSLKGVRQLRASRVSLVVDFYQDRNG